MKEQLRVRKEMNEAVLALLEHWRKTAVDQEKGGYYNVNCWNHVMEGGEKSATLTFRIFWTFTQACMVYGNDAFLRVAQHGFAYIRSHFIDEEYGGIFPMLDAEGKVVSAEKQGYVHSFAIAALANYYRATGDLESLHLARNLFELVKQKGKNEHGGYHDICARDWTPTLRHTEYDTNSDQRDKSLRPNMHLLWGFTELRRAVDFPQLDEALESLAVLLCHRMVNQKDWSVGQAFSGDWVCVSDRDAYGDDFELAWILLDVLPYLRDKNQAERIREISLKIVRHAILSGTDREYGGIYQQFHHDKITTDKEWWVQAEAINGLLSAYQETGDAFYFEEAARCWDFVRDKLIEEDGTWKWKVRRKGETLTSWQVRGPLMCPYHSGRMLLRSLKLLGNDNVRQAGGSCAGACAARER